MADIIQVEHETLETVAAKFSQQAEAVEQMYQNVQNTMNRLKNDWIGRGSEAFFSEMEKEVLPAVRRLIDALALANDVTKEVNQVMQQADEEAASPFKNETAGGGANGTGAGASAANGARGGGRASPRGCNKTRRGARLRAKLRQSRVGPAAAPVGVVAKKKRARNRVVARAVAQGAGLAAVSRLALPRPALLWPCWVKFLKRNLTTIEFGSQITLGNLVSTLRVSLGTRLPKLSLRISDERRKKFRTRQYPAVAGRTLVCA